MSLPQNVFKQGLRRTPPMLGTWFMSGSPTVAEALGWAGFDFLVIDMEHSATDVPQVLELLRALAGTPAASVVRLPWNDPVIVKRVLDAGAQSLMFPYIESAAEARRAVGSTRYPPGGMRGVAAMQRASRYATVVDYGRRAEEEICVILQIETPAALGNLPEIAAVEGVDSLFIGPADLSASMGLVGQVGHEDVQTALAGAAHACRDLAKPVGIVGPAPEMVRRFLGYGYGWVAVSSDLAMVLGHARDYVAAVRAG